MTFYNINKIWFSHQANDTDNDDNKNDSRIMRLLYTYMGPGI